MPYNAFKVCLKCSWDKPKMYPIYYSIYVLKIPFVWYFCPISRMQKRIPTCADIPTLKPTCLSKHSRMLHTYLPTYLKLNWKLRIDINKTQHHNVQSHYMITLSHYIITLLYIIITLSHYINTLLHLINTLLHSINTLLHFITALLHFIITLLHCITTLLHFIITLK